jgi:metal-responsive CopG/Arc/MetJ family transcriptional regulator
MSKARVTITIDRDLHESLIRYSRMRKLSRSRAIEEAIRFWQRSQRERDLIEGYRAMAREDAAVAESNLPAGLEAWDRR